MLEFVYLEKECIYINKKIHSNILFFFFFARSPKIKTSVEEIIRMKKIWRWVVIYKNAQGSRQTDRQELGRGRIIIHERNTRAFVGLSEGSDTRMAEKLRKN